MGRRSFDIAFKKEVIEYMSKGKNCYAAKKYFEKKNKDTYDQSMFQQWYKKRDKIKEQRPHMKRIGGGGKKPSLGSLEQILGDEIKELKIQKGIVTRTFIHDRAVALANEYGIELKATANWTAGFLKRNGFSFQKNTNCTSLTDTEVITRAVEFMIHLKSRKAHLNMQKTLLVARSHIVMKSSGFSSMRVTAMISVWANGKKAMPLVIHKGKDGNSISHQDRVLYTTQSKAWVNQKLIINWIDHMFPLLDFEDGKCIVWDSCRVHISQKVKDHCQKRKIEMIVIPAGLTPYLQAAEIGIFRSLKTFIFRRINKWKNSNSVKIMKELNPKTPDNSLINSWVGQAWNEIKAKTLQNSILSAGFDSNYENWYISKHEIYGEQFCEEWKNSSETKVRSQLIEDNDSYQDFEFVES